MFCFVFFCICVSVINDIIVNQKLCKSIQNSSGFFQFSIRKWLQDQGCTVVVVGIDIVEVSNEDVVVILVVVVVGLLSFVWLLQGTII